MCRKIFLLVLFISISIPAQIFAQGRALGEIVRVNKALKIAYARYDAGLKEGQAVTVTDGTKNLTHLQVKQLTDTIAQLTPLLSEDSESQADFSLLKAGQTITAYSKANAEAPVLLAQHNPELTKDLKEAQELTQRLDRKTPQAFASANVQDMEGEVEKLIEQNKRLLTHLNHLADENKDLKARNLNSKDDIDRILRDNAELKIQLKELKDKLNKSIKQLEESIHVYDN